MLYDMRTKPEYEANIVAAEILLDTMSCWIMSTATAIHQSRLPG